MNDAAIPQVVTKGGGDSKPNGWIRRNVGLVWTIAGAVATMAISWGVMYNDVQTLKGWMEEEKASRKADAKADLELHTGVAHMKSDIASILREQERQASEMAEIKALLMERGRRRR